jgi:hypothetical protein
MHDQPPLTVLPSIPAPEDVPYCGQIELHVDATDVDRCREPLPWPGWLPGPHACEGRWPPARRGQPGLRRSFTFERGGWLIE